MTASKLIASPNARHQNDVKFFPFLSPSQYNSGCAPVLNSYQTSSKSNSNTFNPENCTLPQGFFLDSDSFITCVQDDDISGAFHKRGLCHCS